MSAIPLKADIAFDAAHVSGQEETRLKYRNRRGERYRLTDDDRVWTVFARNAEMDDLWVLVPMDKPDEQQEVLGEELDRGAYWERLP